MPTSDRRLRLAVVNEVLADGPRWAGHVRRIEQSGVGTLLVRDHVAAEPYGPPLAMASAAAAQTTRLRVGTMVLDNDYRHPALVAHEAATIDWLSGGRFELGLGAGWLRGEYNQMGMSFDAARTRIARLGEAASIITALLSGQTVTFRGAHYTIGSLGLPITPVRRPRPPLLIGGGGPRMLALAARHADIVGILPAPHPRRPGHRRPGRPDAGGARRKARRAGSCRRGTIPGAGAQHLCQFSGHKPAAPRHRDAHTATAVERDHLRGRVGDAVDLRWVGRADPPGPAGPAKQGSGSRISSPPTGTSATSRKSSNAPG